ncbi:MAG: MBOAT family O-acyltransferase [Rikenellaceae bacterium]|nr:MBOAT family O-acyltransferase [Rikenellaceae bacterium]
METLLTKIGTLLAYDATSPLIFSSGLFLYLFVGFLALYCLLRNTSRARILYVAAFSLYFYYKTSGWYFLLLIVAATYDYMIGYSLYLTKSRPWRKFLVTMSVVLNLGMLGYFKYTNFFIDLTNDLFGAGFLEFQNIFLPVGISFFVFQSMSYTIDIYREKLRPLDSWLDYLFYLSFFPQLVAGPIVRASHFIPQIRRRPVVTREMLGTAVFLILTGLFKKAVISDYIALNFVDRIFDEPLLYSGFECLMGIYGYALQIYCDFSGYSDMAIGLALVMGFHFPKNFDAPYRSATITEFWRRWHISLSSWLRDYLYISLGGNRKGRLRTYLNLLLTMLLGGLWHGAAIRFILWGALHGVALALHKMWLAVVPGAKILGRDMNPVMRLLGILFTFHLVCLGWLVFRADSMQTAGLIVHQIFAAFDTALIPQIITGYAGAFLLIGIGYLLHFVPEKGDNLLKKRIISAPMWLQIALLVVMIWLVMQVKSSDIQPFIYFQF